MATTKYTISAPQKTAYQTKKTNLPSAGSLIAMGLLRKPQKEYKKANGCYYCAYECDTDRKAKDEAKYQ